jgi:heme exporter protein C
MAGKARGVPENRPRWWAPFGWFTLLFFAGAQAVALGMSPAEQGMGELQKIMYVHVPAAWASFAAFGVVFVSSVLYLWRREERHDLLAASAAEVGAVLTALTLVLGSIWGRPTWGVWWAWDARLTSTAILLMIYAGYLALRAFTEDDEKRARWSAAVGILGFINVPIVHMSVQWWKTLHQVQSSLATVDRPYAVGLGLNGLGFAFALIYFAGSRYYTARLERSVEARLEESGLVEGSARV